MKIETALKQIQREASFLGMSVQETLEFIEQNPLAQPQKTLEAFKVIKTIDAI